MKLMQHVMLSSAVSAGVFFLSRSWPMTVTSWLAGILLDGDHALDYVREHGFRFDPRHFFQVNYGRDYRRTFLVLHAWEWLPPLALVCWWLDWNPWLTGILIGWTQHLVADHLTNTPNKWAYFFVWRWRHGFDHKTAFPLHEK